MKYSALFLALTFMALVGCSKERKDVPVQPSEDLSAYAEKVGNDPLGISNLLSEANQLIEEGKDIEAQKKIRLAEKYYGTEPGYCTVRWVGGDADTYLIAIKTENSQVTQQDIADHSVTLIPVVDKDWPKGDMVWQKMLELRKAGLCKNSGTCHRLNSDIGYPDPMLEFPVYGSNQRIFYIDDREEFLKMARSVGLCI